MTIGSSTPGTKEEMRASQVPAMTSSRRWWSPGSVSEFASSSWNAATGCTVNAPVTGALSVVAVRPATKPIARAAGTVRTAVRVFMALEVRGREAAHSAAPGTVARG